MSQGVDRIFKLIFWKVKQASEVKKGDLKFFLESLLPGTLYRGKTLAKGILEF